MFRPYMLVTFWLWFNLESSYTRCMGCSFRVLGVGWGERDLVPPIQSPIPSLDSSTIPTGSSNGWPVPDAVNTVICVPDDEWRNYPKHVEQLTDKLCIVVSCWIFIVTAWIHLTLCFSMSVKCETNITVLVSPLIRCIKFICRKVLGNWYHKFVV